jgi:hypothetical protein
MVHLGPLSLEEDVKLCEKLNTVAGNEEVRSGAQTLQCWEGSVASGALTFLPSDNTTSIQYSKTNVMHFLFNLLRIKCLYMFRALLAYPQEAINK